MVAAVAAEAVLAKRLLVLTVVSLLALAAGIRAPEPAAANRLTGIVAVSAGHSHTCAITSEEGVKCWGWNGHGQVGNGTTIDAWTPANVSGLTSGVSAVSAGGFSHSCALTTEGGVECWGSNGAGQLGDGVACGSVCSTPVNVTGLTSGVVAISAGSYHTCALTTGGGIKCWGSNDRGQLGDGTTADRSTPTSVLGLTNGVAALSAGGFHTCAVTVAGGVKCWGFNSNGQLGSGTTTDSSIPVDVGGLTNGVAVVSAGFWHTCAVTTGGGVECWGYNAEGELGNGTTMDATTPVDVSSLTSGAAAVSTGERHTCALTTAGSVRCWGFNSNGQLGNGTISSGTTTPLDVSELTSGASSVSAAGLHTCALTIAGGVKCWGANLSGDLGNGTNTRSTTPVDVLSVAKPVCGDVNSDGQANSIDAQLILQYTAGLTQLGTNTGADANHDGVINSEDALLILQYAAGLVSSLSC